MKQETVSNCFRHCGFFRAKCREEPEEIEIKSNEYDELVSEFNLIHPNLSLNSYVEADGLLQVCEPLEEIFHAETLTTEEMVNEGEISEIEDDDNGELDEQQKVYARYEIVDFVQKIKIYGLNSKNEETKLEILSLCNRLETSLFNNLNLNQKKITDFFN